VGEGSCGDERRDGESKRKRKRRLHDAMVVEWRSCSLSLGRSELDTVRAVAGSLSGCLTSAILFLFEQKKKVPKDLEYGCKFS
jgi:hypothetical protein